MAGRLGSIATSSAASRSSHSLVTPAVLALSESTVPQFDAHLLDYLNIEMLQVVTEAAAHAQAAQDARRAIVEQEFLHNYNIDVKTAFPEPSEAQSPQSQTPADKAKIQDEALKARMESIGFKVGWALAERLAKERNPIAKQTQQPASLSTTQNNVILPMPLEPLEVVKFVCKEWAIAVFARGYLVVLTIYCFYSIWITLYDKQIDNLRTNHRGVFVLQDNAFKPLLRLSVPVSSDPAIREEGIRKGRQLLAMPAGLIRGAIAILGISSSVTVDYSGGTQCTFTVKTTTKAT